MLNLRFLYKKIRDSFWFVPTLIIFFSILSAVFLLSIDKTNPFTPEGVFKIIFSENSDSGRNVLTVIAGSMVGIAGTVFSITIVVLQLASSQFGPRLLQNFMYKRLNQIVLGQYVGLFCYCIIVINSIRDNDSYAFIPNLSILCAIFFSIFNVFLLIVFIHNISMSIQPSKIINELRLRIENSIEEMYPLQVSEKASIVSEEKKDDKLIFLKHYCSSGSGYIQYFDLDTVLEKAKEYDIVVKMMQKPGDYIIEKQPVFGIYYREEAPEIPDEEKDDDFDFELNETFTLDKKKTFFQDVAFGIDQIVEIASKALSPSINNPYTAMICIDNLTSVLCRLTAVKIPETVIQDENNVIRVITITDTFEKYLFNAFNLIRQYGHSSPFIIIKMVHALTIIAKFDNKNQYTDILKSYAQILNETAEKSFMIERDIKDFKHAFTSFKVSVV